MRFIIGLVILIMASGCSASGLEEYRDSAEHIVNELSCELQSCENQEQLQQHAPKLKKLFQKLVELVIDAREYQIKHPEEAEKMSIYGDRGASDRLLNELNRIYELEGGRQIVELSQKDALERLDAFESRFQKKYH
ncbi:MAG: hypothetical protein JHC93_04195 [Parachlamydiales bacterium]|nr:hypothetical protein [Parachlamydiales bacterium]